MMRAAALRISGAPLMLENAPSLALGAVGYREVIIRGSDPARVGVSLSEAWRYGID
jgi:hypothetical protein